MKFLDDMELLGLKPLGPVDMELLRLAADSGLPPVLLTRQQLKRAYGLCK